MKPHKKSIRDFFSPAPPNNAHAAPPQTNIHTPAPSQTAPVPVPVPPTTSRRITSNGTEVVLNSDSDDDSLPDLDFGITAPKPNPPKTATITTRCKRTSANDDDGLRIPTKKARDDKKKFDTLVQTAQKNLETERRIQEHKAVLNKAVEEPVTTRITINEETLGQAVQDDDDDPHKAHRLLQAMQRTNATQMETVFYFFEHDVGTIPMQTKFPINILPQHRWASNFQRPDTRDQAFMTGFAQHIFRVQELPKELASWMIDQICYNQNEALNCKYLEILQAHHDHLHDLLDAQRLDAIFKTIGTNITQLEAKTQLLPLSVPQSEIKTFIPPFLKQIAGLLTQAATWLQTATRSHALYLLCHVCLDTRVTADFDILHAVQDAMEAIICNFADNKKLISGLNTIIPQLLTKVTHPVLQRNLTCALPAMCPLTAYLQRHLAFSFLLHPTPVSMSLADDKAHDLVLDHITKSPDFFINKNTDYGHLAARLALLDIAIGPGLLAVPYQPLSSSAPSEAGSSPIHAPVPASSEVRQFNEQIDALAQQIKLLGNSIVEAGAVVDIAILETKNSIERMCARLEHASRIGGKKIHDVFGSDEEDSQLRLSKFFKKAHKSSPSAPSRGIFKQNEDSDLDLVDGTQT